MTKKSSQELILKTLKEKSLLKQDVFKNTMDSFNQLKAVIKEVAGELKESASKVDKRLIVDFKEKGEFGIELRVAGDVIIFYMHTNVFEFDKSHPVWKTNYVKEDNMRAYCGMINIFNFLSDSFKYNRVNDVGYLVGRLFINKDLHYFVEGKRQLGFLYNDFVSSPINKEAIRNILESAILYCMNFDLFTPPFEQVKEVTVSEMEEVNLNLHMQTGKRLGFRFQADNDQVE